MPGSSARAPSMSLGVAIPGANGRPVLGRPDTRPSLGPGRSYSFRSGRRPRDARLREIGDRLGRQALHAAVLGFVHPVTGERLRFEAPMPEDMRAALEALRGGAPARG